MSRGFESDNLTDDLISAGIIGLLEVMEKYDATRGAKLNTFAYLRIRGAMIDELRSRDWFPRSARAKAKKIQEVTRRLEHEMGRYPDEEEVAKALNMDLDAYLSMLRSCGNLSVVSIEDVSDAVGESRDRVIDYVLDDDDSPEKYAEFYELERILAGELEKLPERQRLVLSLYYHEDMNMKEIAKTLGVTEARVCQIHSQAILNLRPAMKKHFEQVVSGPPKDALDSNRPQTEILMLEPTAWKRMLLPEVPVALFPRSCMSVAKALCAVARLPDCRALPTAARSVLKVVLAVCELVLVPCELVLAVCELPP